MKSGKLTIVILLTMALIIGGLTIVPQKSEAVYPYFWASSVSQTVFTVSHQKYDPEGDTGLSSNTAYYVYWISNNINDNSKWVYHHAAAASFYQTWNDEWHQVDPQSSSYSDSAFYDISPNRNYWVKVGYTVAQWSPYPGGNTLPIINNRACPSNTT